MLLHSHLNEVIPQFQTFGKTLWTLWNFLWIRNYLLKNAKLFSLYWRIFLIPKKCQMLAVCFFLTVNSEIWHLNFYVSYIIIPSSFHSNLYRMFCIYFKKILSLFYRHVWRKNSPDIISMKNLSWNFDWRRYNSI